jgi:hypothetical protein
MIMSEFKLTLFSAVLIFFTLTSFAADSTSNDNLPFSFMKVLAQNGLHDLNDESWNVYGQTTYISNWHDAFRAKYSNLNGSTNSLYPEAEHGFTGTGTLYFGVKAWTGGEFYLAPELVSEKPFSSLKGLGGVIHNFELQKNGAVVPVIYISRLYVKQIFNLGGEAIHLESAPMQLAATVDSRRLVLRIGNFSILDFFDKNAFSGDLRRQFLNMAFMTHAAYDFAADARGYTSGGVVEYFHDDWAVRFAHLVTPRNPNQLMLDSRVFKYFGDQFEIEHHHTLAGQPGAVRILGYRNRENMGSWKDAMAALQSDPTKNATLCPGFNYESENSTAPDLCWARKANIKMGIGINLEQQVADDIGLFFRGMYSDGKTEVYSYTSTDRSLSFGTLIKGTRWQREKDLFGLGYAKNWISKAHADYLNAGGIDGFIGDGKITARPEQVINVFYSVNLLSSVWLSGDYQHIINPAFNADRGPINVYGVKMHVEF